MILITIISYGQGKIKKLEVKEEGINININFQPVVDKITYNGLTIKITPISTDELNSLFLRESTLDGKFEYSHYEKARKSYFLKKRKRNREKSDFEFLLEGASWLMENEKITQQEYDELVEQIIFNYDRETGNEIYSPNRIISSNPYYINNKYLSVFKIEISNQTQSHLSFDENITVECGNSIFRPLPTNLIIEELKRSNLMNVNKALTLERHNLQNSISIPPNSNFEKLFAVLPIDYNSNTLLISFSGTNTKFKWEVVKNEKIINELYTYYEFEIDWYYSGTVSKSGVNFNVLKSKQTSVYLGYNELFIGEDYLSQVFEIFTLSLFFNEDGLYFGRNRIRGSDFLDKEKNRRKAIQIITHRMETLKKKVKQ